ncbi:periplasmic binding protein-like II [Neocallimastix lanati (nom. inval.)]|nr:periplasmic binding protein-like II [Neocallimastix sp. JGI-2020a]
MKSLLVSLLFVTIFVMVNGIEITMHGFLYAYSDYHKNLAERTNAYMKSKGLDITLKTNFETPDTSRGEPNYVANYVEDLLQKEDRGYDLYITDTVYTGRFSKYFEDIHGYVDKKVIDLYKEGTATNTCIVDTRLVGLPLMVDYGGLYANMDLLKKYNKPVPETWDELIETTNYIYEKESPTNPQLHKYLAHFPEYENGLVVLLEFINSFRDASNDKFPEYTSDNAIAALEKMKQIKETASTPDDFAANEITMGGAFQNGDFIFLRFWYIGDEMKTQTNVTLSFNQLPGKKKGVSASCVGGSNISMNRFISEEKKKAAGEVMSFIHSFDHQKLGVMENDLRSAIHSTYSDPQICGKINCPKFSSMQSIVRPSSSSINYDDYSAKFRELARKYIYGETDQSAKEILIEVEDIRRIHYVEINSTVSIIILSLAVITIALLISSYIYISIKRFRQQFIFLPFNYWCVLIFGILLMTFYCLTGIQKLNNYSCLIRPFLLSVGFNLIYIPLLLKMISIFPKKNGFSKFVKDHFTLLFLCSLIIDIAINIGWYLLDPLIVNKLTVTSGKNFQYCSSFSTVGNVFKYILFGIKIFILVVMSVLVFTEWSLVAFKSDIRSITTTIYTNLLLIVLFIVIENINVNSRYLYYGLRAGLVLIFSLSTLVIIIGSKFYQINFKKEDQYPDIRSFNKSSSSGINSSNYYQSTNNGNASRINQNKSTLLSYHYHTGVTTSPPNAAVKSYPALFTSTINSNYNENIFNNSSNNTQSQSSESMNKSYLYSNNNYSNNNYSSNNYSSNNYSSNNYSNNNYSNNNYSNNMSFSNNY